MVIAMVLLAAFILIATFIVCALLAFAGIDVTLRGPNIKPLDPEIRTRGAITKVRQRIERRPKPVSFKKPEKRYFLRSGAGETEITEAEARELGKSPFMKPENIRVQES